MKHAFAHTSNVMKFLGGLSALKNRGAGEASWLLLTGLPGLGKSETVQWWAVQHGAVYLRAKANWTPAEALQELLIELRVQPTSRQGSKLWAQAYGALTAPGAPPAIVIDEVEHGLHNIKILESFRDFSDVTEITVVLVGMEKVKALIQRHEQIASRITQVIEFLPASADDVQTLAHALTDYMLDADVLAEILRASDGRNRIILDALATIERFCGRNRPTIQAPNGRPLVTLAHLAGEKLCHDWRTRTRRPATGVQA